MFFILLFSVKRSREEKHDIMLSDMAKVETQTLPGTPYEEFQTTANQLKYENFS